MTGVRRLILFNQVTGPLFRQLAEGLAPRYPDGCLLVTGHPEQLTRIVSPDARLVLKAAPPYNRRSRLRRVLSWLRYTLHTTRYVLLARKSDAIVLVSNPPLLGPWVWLLSHLRRVPYAVLVYDIHPDVLIRLGVLKGRGWMARLWRVINRRVYRRAHAVVTIGNRMAAALQKQVGSDGPRVTVVPPWVNVDVIQPLPREQNPHADTYTPSGPVVVLYSGNMGASHDIDSILKAAYQLRDEPEIFFLLIGEGEKHAEAVAFAKRHQLSNLRVFPFQPEDRLPFTLPLGDISLVALDEGMEDLMVPSKAFFYLAAGSALIGIANKPSELSDLLGEGEIGLRVSPRQPEALAQGILSLAADRKKLAIIRTNARRLAESRYSRDAGVDAFAGILDQSGLGANDAR